jgi:two-component system, NarL family, response regulator YdfI
MTRVVIGAASEVARAGLASLLTGAEDVVVAGSATTAEDLSRVASAAAPDVALLDDDGSDAAQALVSNALDGPREWAVVLLSDAPLPMPSADGRVPSGSAVLPRRATAAEIGAAISAAAAGLIVTHPDLVPRDGAFAGPGRVAAHSAALTPRELEVLQMLGRGLPNKSIARRLGVSAHTVKFHVGSIMSKLRSSSRTEAVTEGIRRGLIFL